eukprot:TRINITY_DN159_c0_g1_i7.p1 TRINITY_DN159_c0_g1~~TRINITY_DN159_c0_g1_i7.p1  ORF type:complete len:2480 (-),score=532.94 TRINITY_DN159_c0_g1_i7:244-7683(-)
MSSLPRSKTGLKISLLILALSLICAAAVEFDGPWSIRSTYPPPHDSRASFTYKDAVYYFPEAYIVDWDEDERTINHVYRFYDIFNFKSDMLMTTGPAPLIRDDYCSTRIGKKAYFFGGITDSFQNDLSILDLETLEWTAIEPQGKSIPAGRRLPVCFEYNGAFHVYSGLLPVDVANDLWRFDEAENQWTQIGFNSKTWPIVYAPILSVYQNTLYVYGGRSVTEVIMNEFWRFPFETREWEKLELSNPNGYEIPGSYLGSFATIGNMLYFVAGQNKPDDYFPDAGIYGFNLDKIEFSMALLWPDEADSYPYTLDYPMPRIYSSMEAIGTNLFFYGGEAMYVTDDAWIFDTVAKEWTHTSQRVYPIGRVGSYIANLGSSKFAMFGGMSVTREDTFLNDLWVFDLAKSTWEMLSERRLPTPGDVSIVPPPLEGPIVCATQQDFYILGGLPHSEDFTGPVFFKFNFASRSWSKLILPGKAEYLGLAYNQAYICDGSSVRIWGGRPASNAVSKSKLSNVVLFSLTSLEYTIEGIDKSFDVRFKSSAFTKAGMFCIQGGSVVEFEPEIDVWCFSQDKKMWSRLVGSNGGIDPLDNALFLSAGLGFLPGGSDEAGAPTNDIKIYDFNNEFWDYVELPAIRPASFATYAAFVDGGNIIFYSMRMFDVADNRVWSYSIGKTFCSGTTEVEVDGSGHLVDGSGDFGYAPYSSCSWTIKGTNNLVIEEMGMDEQSSVVISLTSECGDPDIYVDGQKMGNEVLLSRSESSTWISVPSGQFKVTFQTSSSYTSNTGFDLFYTLCPAGFTIDDGECNCPAGNFITPSGECAECPLGTSQIHENQRFCVSDQALDNSQAPVEMPAGVTVEVMKRFPSCEYAASTTHLDRVYVICGAVNGEEQFQSVRENITMFSMSSLYTLEWDIIESKGDIPPIRKGACLVPSNLGIHYIGGQAPTDQDMATYLYSPATNTWTRKKKGEIGHSGHTCVVGGGMVYLHGGESQSGDILDTMFSYNIATDVWTRLDFKNSPLLSYHTGWFVEEGKLYIFGGYDGSQEVDTLWYANLAKKEWIENELSLDDCLDCVLAAQESCGLARQMASIAVYEDYAYLFGGFRGDSALQDMIKIHIKSLLVEEILDYSALDPLPLRAPSPRMRASLTGTDGKLVLFGGSNPNNDVPTNTLWVYDIGIKSWTASTSTLKPAARQKHATIDIDDDAFVVFGGLAMIDGEAYSNELWLFNQTSNKWICLSEQQNDDLNPSPRYDASIGYYDGSVFVLSGKTALGSASGRIWKASLPELSPETIYEPVIWEVVEHTSTLNSRQNILKRAAVASVVEGDSMLMWGGQVVSSTGQVEDYNSVYEFNMKTYELSAWSVDGAGPIARMYHCAFMQQSNFCIFGGRDFKNRVLGDVWCYSTDSSSWSRLYGATSPQIRRYAMSCGVVGEHLVISGGLDESNSKPLDSHAFQFATGAWIRLENELSENDVPSAFQSGVMSGNTMFKFGGLSDLGVSDGVYATSVGMCSSTTPNILEASRDVTSVRFPENEGNIIPGTYCEWSIEAANSILINATIEDGDKIEVYSQASPNSNLLATLDSGSPFYVLAGASSGLIVRLNINGSVFDGVLERSISMQFSNCPQDALYGYEGCRCDSGFYEDEKSNSCLQCKAGIDDPACPQVGESEDSTLMYAIIGGVGGGVFLIGAVLYKRHRDHMKDIAAREQKMFLHVAFKELEFGPLLGTGSFGEVFKGTWRGTEVAIKRLNFEKITKGAIKEFESEVSIMVELRHPNVVLYMAACVEPPNLCIVSELMTRGSLYDIIHNEQIEMTLDMQMGFLIDAAKGLQYLHLSNPPILHRDLKSPNLLLDEKWNLKISDFGLTGVQEQAKKGDEPPGTLFWMAPEVVRGGTYTEKADVYSYAVICWEIFTRAEPYEGEIAESVALRVANEGLRPKLPGTDIMPQQVQDLVKKAWDQTPDERPGFPDILKELNSVSSSLSNSAASRKAGEKEPAPTGMIAVVFTDVQGSTSMWEKAPGAMSDALHAHNDIMRGVIRRNKGYEVKTEGDAFMITFSSVKNALNFCMQSQEMLIGCDWDSELLDHPAAQLESYNGRIIFRGIRVRMGIHYGEPICREDPVTGRMDYFGPVINRAARVGGFPKGGQVAMSEPAYMEVMGELVNLGNPHIRDLGIHQLKGLDTADHLYEVLPQSLADRASIFSGESNIEKSNVLTLTGQAMEKTKQEAPTSWQIEFSEISISQTQLGAGSYGTVFLGEFKGEQVAVKRLLKQKMAEKQYFGFLSEIMIIKELHHPHILKFHGASVKQPNICIVVEYAPHGSLRDLLNNTKAPISVTQQKAILAQVADAMTYLHALNPPIFHRDLKSPNILVSSLEPVDVKVADFGFARAKADNQTMTKCGTRAWLAPEILRGLKYDEKADVFSFGIMAWEVASRQRPYSDIEPVKIGFEVVNGTRPVPPKNADPVLVSLMKRCWDPEPTKRPRFEEVFAELS